MEKHLEKGTDEPNPSPGEGAAGRSIREKIRKFFRFFTNPRLLMCFALAWMVSNGWSYLLLGIGTFFDIPWATAVAGAYLAFLWLPGTPEKLLTFAIAIALLRRLFPGDEKTLGVLRQWRESLKEKLRKKRRP